jgi:hypothetical protein
MVVREGSNRPWEEPLKNRTVRFLTAVLLLAGALPLAEAAPKRNCGDRCSNDYSSCMARAKSGSARKSCKQVHKSCKRTCI